MSVRAYVGLGSNLGQPVEQLSRALDELDGIHRTRLVARSRLYRNPPMGPGDQPDYVNAVAAVETSLDPRALLAELQIIENLHGRVRESARRWGPRTLDLDLLVYGERVCDEPGLTVPHPGVATRAFVLVPLAEIAPDLDVPRFGRVSVLLASCDTTMLHPVDGEGRPSLAREAG